MAGATRLEVKMGPFPSLKSPTATLLMIDGLALPDGRVVHPPLAMMETIEREMALLLRNAVAALVDKDGDEYERFTNGWNAAIEAALAVFATDDVVTHQAAT